MEIAMVAFESMGIRSMCTHVRTPELSILIDPGLGCHTRSGVKPHPLEYEVLVRKWAQLLSLSREIDLITVSHYHIHHYSPSVADLVTTLCTQALADEIYAGKMLFCKDPARNVSDIQAVRGMEFRRAYGTRSPKYELADGRSFKFGKTCVSFSPALWHGKDNTPQGFVIGICVTDRDTTFVHASDVQLLNRGCIDWMLDQRPDIAVVAGPPLFDPERMKGGEREIAAGYLRELSNRIPRLVVDHHLLRGSDWREFLAESGAGTRVRCAAESEGVPPSPLESKRQALYEEEEVEKEFHQQLLDGKVPDRLGSVIREEGLESYYEASLMP